jgi:anti-anti-sigma factor
MNCTATVRHSGAVSIIDLAGRITHAAGSGAIREAIKAELQHDRKNILLNLNAVDYIDSSGLGEMAGAFSLRAPRYAVSCSPSRPNASP